MIQERSAYHTRPIRETGINPERLDLITWYRERLEDLPEIIVETVNATDGTSWKAVLEGEQIREISGAFFVVRGSLVTKRALDGSVTQQWNQPGIHQTETELILPTREGDLKVKTSGFVGILRDEYANVLVTLAQEPYARAPKNALFRTPFQTSAVRFARLLVGEREADTNLFDLLQKIGGSEDIRSMFASEKIDSFPLPYADANRIDATNYGFAVTISDSEFRENLKNNERNRWCSPVEVREIMRAGLLNGVTASAIFASTSLIK